jgi:capsular exopolysaccharide synthesis family protein
MKHKFSVLQRARAALPDLRPFDSPSLHADGNRFLCGYENIVEDEILKLVQRLFILPDSVEAPQAVAFCGVDRGTGCSWVCAKASETLAERAPGTVCLVDGNLRYPWLHEYFQLQNGAGLSDALNDCRPIREFARRTWVNKLSLITAGSARNETRGTLDIARLRALFAELRSEFDYVLIDTPHIVSCADAILLGQLTDGVVLVVSSGSTRRHAARVAKENLEAEKIPMLGAVLNKRTYPIPEMLYRRL